MRQIAFLNRKWRVDVASDADESVLAEIFICRDYLPVEPELKAAKTAVLDVGAHKGFFVLYARALNATVPIYAYEPEEKNFAALKQHVDDNKVEGVFAKNVAVAGKDGSLTLHVNADSHNHSILDGVEGEQKLQKVTAASLDKILSKKEFWDVVKMDCEGAEYEIFKHTSPESFQKIGVLFLEYHEFNSDMKVATLKTLFEKNGFKVKMAPSKYDKRMGFLIAKRS